MFGIGFTEFILIAIVAILFLGPDKLPQAMVEIAKFIKGAKQAVTEAKDALDEEVKIADLKEEALNFKRQLTDASDELNGFKNITFEGLDDELTPAQKHRKQIEEEAAKHKQSDPQEPATTQVEPKQEFAQIKSKPKTQDPYTQANDSFKDIPLENSDKKGEI